MINIIMKIKTMMIMVIVIIIMMKRIRISYIFRNVKDIGFADMKKEDVRYIIFSQSGSMFISSRRNLQVEAITAEYFFFL